MMDNLLANKSGLSCQAVGQNAWSTTSSQGSLFNPMPSSQNLGLGSSSNQRPSYEHLQASNLSCMNNMNTLSSTHHPALYKASHMSSSSSSTTLFSNTAIPSSSHSISFPQQSHHTLSELLPANQGQIAFPPSLSQTIPAVQQCGPKKVPPLPPCTPHIAPFQPPSTNESLTNGLQDLPLSLALCRQGGNTTQAAFEGANVEFAGASGSTQGHASSTSQEQCQSISLPHCSEAASESVPDAVAHTDKGEPQEGNVTALTSNEKRRLVLLHQRAQLLKQLKELDKLLEAISSDDSDDDQSTHITIKSRLSEYGASPHQSETCEDPEDPEDLDDPEDPEDLEDPEDQMSAAESVKSERVSAESEDDSDPDHCPKSEGDFSDILPSHEEVSSDKSSHSIPASPAKEKPSLPKKRKAEPQSSSLKAKNVNPPKKTQRVSLKKSSEAIVLPSSNGVHRVYDRKNYCLYCSKPLSKMSRHLMRVHNDKAEVAAAFQYPQNSRERQKIWNRLINQGNFVHNKMVLKTGIGKLAVRKRPSDTRLAGDFLHCLFCKGFFIKHALKRHMKHCSERLRDGKEMPVTRKIGAQCVLQTLDDLDVTEGFRTLLSQMTYDEVTQAVLDDKLILQFGELSLKQIESDGKKQEHIRQNLRQLARLVLEAQKMTPLKKLEDFFLPSNFQHVVSAVNALAGYNPRKKAYTTPSLAFKLGFHLRKACGIVESKAVQSGDTGTAESAQNFLTIFQEKWNKLVSSGALTTLRKTKLTKNKHAPTAQDVECLNFHMENVHRLAEKTLIDDPGPGNYAALVKVVLARTAFFNEMRTKEISTLQLNAFMSRKKSSLDPCMNIPESELEKKMHGFLARIDIRGRCGRMMPVFLKPSLESAMELFIKLREKCGVPSKNPFLFGRPHTLSAYSGSECIQKYVKECGAQDPETMTTVKIRTHCAEKVQLDENEADQIVGPNNPVRKLRQNTGLGDGRMNSHKRLQPARGQQGASWDHHEHPSTHYGHGQAEFYDDQAHGATTGGQQTASWDHNENNGTYCGLEEFYNEQVQGATSGSRMTSTSAKTGKKGAQNQGKQRWEEAEILAIERHLMHLIEGHIVPQKNDCIQCLEAEPEALKSRSWRSVKDYVRNRITSLKRQKKTPSQAKSTKSNWSGQGQQQQQRRQRQQQQQQQPQQQQQQPQQLQQQQFYWTN